MTDVWVSEEEEQLFVRFVKEILTDGYTNYTSFWDDKIAIDGVWTISPELKEAMLRVINLS